MKRSDKHGGNVQDAICSRCPIQITKARKKKVLEVVNKNSWLTLEEISNIANVVSQPCRCLLAWTL